MSRSIAAQPHPLHSWAVRLNEQQAGINPVRARLRSGRDDTVRHRSDQKTNQICPPHPPKPLWAEEYPSQHNGCLPKLRRRALAPAMGSMAPKKRVNTMDTAVSRPRLAASCAELHLPPPKYLQSQDC